MPTHTLTYRYRFGSAEFDESRFELKVNGAPREVQRKPLKVLAMLLGRAEEAVTRAEILAEVWRGRRTVDNVVGNAIAKLRHALGEANADYIQTLPRVGFRFSGPLERSAVGRTFITGIDLVAGAPLPHREQFTLLRLLDRTPGREVWLVENPSAGERRVYKFVVDGSRLNALKHEATVLRVLRKSLGERLDFVRALDHNFEAAPFFLGYEEGGVDLSRWSTTEHLAALGSDARIELLLKIADAVAAAHGVGVLHKDLKPTNILISRRPDGWQVKLSDFGSARLLDLGRIAALDITRSASSGVDGSNEESGATLMYVAPEILAGHEPTVQSDVYSLALILYQLLCGDMHRPMVSGWQRDIDDDLLREDLARATDGALAERLPTVSALIDRLRGLKVRRLERERERALQAAVNRARARRPWIITALASLTIGLVAMTWLYVREMAVERLIARSESTARRAASRAEEVTAFLNEEVLSSGDPFLGERHARRTVKDALDDAATALAGRFAQDPSTEASIRVSLGMVYLRISENADAETQFKRAVELLGPRLARDDARLAQAHYLWGQALAMSSKFPAAQSELMIADALPLPTDPKHTLELLKERSWGLYYLDREQMADAIPRFERAHALLLDASPPDPASLDLVSFNLSESYIGDHRFADAEHLMKELLHDLAHRPRPSELTQALAKYSYGESLMYQQRYDEARAPLDDAMRVSIDRLGLDNLRTMTIISARCSLFSFTNQSLEALRCTQQLYDAQRARNGDRHWLTWAMLANVGVAQYLVGHYRDAEHTLAAAHAGLIETIGQDKSTTEFARYYWSRSLIQLGEADRAAPLTRTLDAKTLEAAEPGAPWSARLTLVTGQIDASQRRWADAAAKFKSVITMTPSTDPSDTTVKDAERALHDLDAHRQRSSLHAAAAGSALQAHRR